MQVGRKVCKQVREKYYWYFHERKYYLLVILHEQVSMKIIIILRKKRLLYLVGDVIPQVPTEESEVVVIPVEERGVLPQLAPGHSDHLLGLLLLP